MKRDKIRLNLDTKYAFEGFEKIRIAIKQNLAKESSQAR